MFPNVGIQNIIWLSKYLLAIVKDLKGIYKLTIEDIIEISNKIEKNIRGKINGRKKFT